MKSIMALLSENNSASSAGTKETKNLSLSTLVVNLFFFFLSICLLKLYLLENIVRILFCIRQSFKFKKQKIVTN